MTTANHPYIRWMRREDVPRVLKIFAYAQRMWTPSLLIDYLENHQHCVGVVADNGAEVLGGMIYQLRKDEFKVDELVVDPDFRRQGVGSMFLRALVCKLHRRASAGRTRLEIEVNDRNLLGLRFLRSHGFLAAGISEDDQGYVMQYVKGGAKAVFRNRIKA